MQMISNPLRRMSLAALLPVAIFLGSCATAPPARVGALPFDVALDQAIDDLFAQTQRLPAFMADMESKLKLGTIVVDPLLDGAAGHQTVVTKQAEQRVIGRVGERFKQFTVLPFSSAEVGRAQYVLTGTLTQVGSEASDRGNYRLNLALTEVKNGLVVAQAGARIRDEGLDTSPTAFYRDSPVAIKDRIVEGYIRTTESKPGAAADPVYLEHLSTSALLADAINAYNGERLSEALTLYEAALKRPDGQQLKVLNGLYLTNWQLGRRDAAEKAFGMVARLGLATNNLSVKFLFKPGTTDFWPDPVVSAPYPIWLRQIARQTASSGQCVNLVGHTSRTGSEQFNERLSLQRASAIRQRLETEAPELVRRLRETGVGFRENIVGTGSDDLRDALDRRVEFRVVKCEGQ